MVRAVRTPEATSETSLDAPSPRLSHGVCLKCYPEVLSGVYVDAVAMCGEPDWALDHLCDYPGMSCGCVVCAVCADFTEQPCPACGNTGAVL